MNRLPLNNKRFVPLLNEVLKLRSANESYFGDNYNLEGEYLLQQNPDEFAALCLFLLDNGPYTNYLEIGTASGGTDLALYQLVDFKHIFSIDAEVHSQFTQKLLSQIPNIKQFVGDIHSPCAKRWLQKNVNLFDVIFIDGDHSAEGVWKDVQLSLEFSHPGTILIFHDIVISWIGVEKTWWRCIQEGLLTSLAIYIGRKKPRGIGIGEVN